MILYWLLLYLFLRCMGHSLDEREPINRGPPVTMKPVTTHQDHPPGKGLGLGGPTR